jgi:hypothetical protein
MGFERGRARDSLEAIMVALVKPTTNKTQVDYSSEYGKDGRLKMRRRGDE